ncbi:MAG: DNA polymerase III subunit gamma/tau [Lachnospiraceae bacterium]|nr:DNA polymerase III subunit gamma/tau [Lachnospiraceae bacterium]
MAYTALYRKWRPKSFDEMVGQEGAVRALTNQVKTGRIGHAYLFCGTRGTGKTTAAKIFARAVNCEHPVNGSPCNECRICRSILDGSSMNVIEIDAASNNGVDNIRQIRDEVAYSPTEGNYRVYIIDEVHMLSPGAYNALLKTLEEPPEYVIFILATTEVHKLPVTVLSRCQRYDFRRISAQNIEGQLNKLIQAEGIEAQPEAVTFIARAADGALRDALSILEECISYGAKLTYENVLDIVGAADTDVFASLLDSIQRADAASAMKICEDLCYSGRDIGQSTADFVWFLRNILLVRTSDVKPQDIGVTAETLGEMKKIAANSTTDDLLKYIDQFSRLENSLRVFSEKRALFEAAVIRAMMKRSETDTDGILARVRELEKAYEQIAAGGAPIHLEPAAITGPPKEEETVTVEVDEAVYDDLEEIRKKWSAILYDSEGAISGIADSLKLSYSEGMGFTIVATMPLNISIVEERLDIIEKMVLKHTGKTVKLTAVKNTDAGPEKKFVKKKVKVPKGMLGMEIEEENDQ